MRVARKQRRLGSSANVNNSHPDKWQSSLKVYTSWLIIAFGPSEVLKASEICTLASDAAGSWSFGLLVCSNASPELAVIHLKAPVT